MVAMFDLYSVFVDYVFGGLLLAIVGLAVIYLLVMILGKLNGLTILAVLFLFIAVCGIFYSAITFFIILIGTLAYFFYSLIRFFSGGLN